ncbi:Integrator complex subunit 9 [Coemansia sp. Benny D115]|nr:Integrator complex subunit 9 [Coemansia sp. Benny D115]
MPNISVVSYSPSERHHLLLCELDDTMFIVDCGWPAPVDIDDAETNNSSKQRLQPGYNDAQNIGDARDILGAINWERVDFVLISNYEQIHLLPFITEYTGFSGPVYATEPTKAYGRCVLEEYVSQGLYSKRDVVAAMERVTGVRHSEIVSPVPFVQAYTRSSGYAIGAGNWTVEYKGHRTAFISTSTVVPGLHPQEWDGRTVSDAQALVFLDAIDTSESGEPLPVGQQLAQLCSAAVTTLKQRSRVLLVGEPWGVTQDVVQVVAETVQALGMAAPQFVFVSGIAERTIQYGNIMGEWLCQTKQALLYLPEYPFADKDLRQRGHLHFFSSLADLAQRNLPQGAWFVVVSPKDTETIRHFVNQWQHDASTCSGADLASGTGASRFAVLMHDDDAHKMQRLMDHTGIATARGAQVSYVPIMRRLTAHTIEQCLAAAAHAQHVLVPSHVYARLENWAATRAEFSLFEYSRLQATTVDLDTDRHLPLDIQREMARRMKAEGKQHALVSGRLALAAGRIRLECADGSSAGDKIDETKALDRDVLVTWTAERLTDELVAAGLDAKVQDTDYVRVVVPGGSATIYMGGTGWSVDCSSVTVQWAVMDPLRRVLKNAT